MNRSLSSRIFSFFFLFFIFFFLSLNLASVGGNEKHKNSLAEGDSLLFFKKQREFTTGWLPKLLFVIAQRPHIQLNTDQSSHSPRRDPGFCRLTFLYDRDPLDYPANLIIP